MYGSINHRMRQTTILGLHVNRVGSNRDVAVVAEDHAEAVLKSYPES
jgi:hypothetical protein